MIGFKEADGKITIHKRDCPTAIRLASQFGDNICSVEFKEDNTLYSVEIEISCVDRYHMIIDIVDCISNTLGLSIESINTETHDSIVSIHLRFAVHSFNELQSIVKHLSSIPDVDEVKLISNS